MPTPYRDGLITLTKEQHDAVRYYLDRLKPGFYVKCARCGRWTVNEPFEVHWTAGEQVVWCGRCAA